LDHLDLKAMLDNLESRVMLGLSDPRGFKVLLETKGL